MKHVNKLTAIFVMTISLLSSCCVDSTLPDATKECSEYYVIASEPEFSSEYDRQISLFTKTVRNAIANNESFRGLIKKQSSLMLTGDFDVLMNTISDTQVEVSDENILTKGASSSMTVNDLLCSYLPEDVKTKSTGNNIIEDLQSQYPDLQISVPVHADEWNPDTYTPVVAFRPEDYQDSTVTVIPGYDAEGNFVWVDAVNVPDKPVIVVGESERALNEIIVFPGDSVTIIDKPLKPMQPSNQPPKAPTNLTFNVTSNSIILSWRQDSPAEGYSIFRKESGENEFSYIGDSEGYQNKTYEDKYLKSNATYAYYVVAYNYTFVDFNGMKRRLRQTSEMSNLVIVKAPDVLGPLSYFEAVTSGEQVELRWNNDGHIDNDVIIEYKVPGMGVTEYYNLLETTGAYNNYIYNSPFKGTQVDYRAYRSNGIGASDAVYDYIYPPYRNAADYALVYVKSISYTDNRAERWPAGKPEFFLKIVGTDGNGNTVELQDEIEFLFSSLSDKRDKIEYFENRLVHTWDPINVANWYSAITFYLEEWDAAQNVKNFTANAHLNYKDTLGLEAGVGAGITVDFSKAGEKCGRTYTNYFDNPEIELLFPNYGAKIRLSEKP